MEIREIKQQLSILAVLKHYNLPADRNNMLKCPFHEDDTASMKIYPETNTYNCFGCHRNGDAIEFCSEKEGSKHEGLLKAAELCGNVPPAAINTNTPETIRTQVDHSATLQSAFESFRSGLLRTTSKKAREYASQRGLKIELLEVGFNSGQYHVNGKMEKEKLQTWVDAGLLIPFTGKVPNGSGPKFTPFAKDCLIFSLKEKDGRITGLYGRGINETRNGSGKHFYLKNRKGLYPGYPGKGTRKLILTEAVIDAATLLQIPEITKSYSILACYGTNGLTAEHKEAISELQDLEEVIFFFDGDKPAVEAIERYEQELTELIPGIKITKVDTPEGEDVNSLVQGHDAEILTHLIENRKELFSLIEKTEPEEEPAVEPDPKPTGILNTTNPEYITYTTEDLKIIILGGINLQQLDRLRMTIKLSRSGSGNPLHSIRHTLDLYHSDYLEKFISKACEQLEISTNTVRKALAELTDQVESYRLSRIESMKEKKPQARELSEYRQRRAINYLRSKKLMQRTGEDIGNTGMVGEENNRLLMYLVFTSRLREQPLHVISLGASGTGKTYLQEKISELIPEENKLEITILSENAFYYFDRKELKQKLVLIEDMDGAEQVLYPLRELQSKKKISKTIPIKDSKGNLKTITLHVEGPICLAGTTTRERLYEDNANRSLLIYLDTSNEQKEKIMEYQRRASAGKIDARQEKELREFFKDMQSVLKPVKVRNPYAEHLKLPEHVFKPLRTNSHYLAVIETITFYHQYQRELKTDPKTGERYIETSLDDIRWANKLLRDVLLTKSDELSRATREFFERLKKWMKENDQDVFYAKEIRETFRMTSSSCNRYILDLLRNGYIKVTGGNKYRQGYEYQVVRADEYQRLQEHVKTALDEALERIEKELHISGNEYPSIPPVSQKENGILKDKQFSKLSPVSQ
jgi:DNA primase catalytic core